MKTKFTRNVLLLALTIAIPASAATLEKDTPLYQAPNTSSPVVTTLPAGSKVEPFQPVNPGKAVPDGWVVINHKGSIQVYVNNGDISKDLTVRPNSKLYASPNSSAPVIGVSKKGDESDIISTKGDWSKMLVNTSVTGYLPKSALADDQPSPAAATPATDATAQSQTAQPATSAAADVQSGQSEAQQPAAEAAPPANQAIPRLFQGILRPTRRIFGMGPKYRWQLVDDQGQRLLFLDVSTLMLTNPLDFFVGKKVNVFGVGSTPANSDVLVVKVESLSLTR